MVKKETKEIILEYLNNCKLMSVSTLHNGQPRSFVGWFSVDKDFNFYFISSQKAVHIEDIEKDSSVSLSVVDSKVGEYGVGKSGLQGLMIEGDCERVWGMDLIKGALNFLKKFPNGKEYIKMIGDSKVELGSSKLYRIVPRSGVWFDQINFEDAKVDLDFD